MTGEAPQPSTVHPNLTPRNSPPPQAPHGGKLVDLFAADKAAAAAGADMAIELTVSVAMSIQTHLRDVLRSPADRNRLRAVPIRMRALGDHFRHP